MAISSDGFPYRGVFHAAPAAHSFFVFRISSFLLAGEEVAKRAGLGLCVLMGPVWNDALGSSAAATAASTDW
jgi:hypothetical protein